MGNYTKTCLVCACGESFKPRPDVTTCRFCRGVAHESQRQFRDGKRINGPQSRRKTDELPWDMRSALLAMLPPVGCSTCAYGRENDQSWSGYECSMNLGLKCRPGTLNACHKVG